MIVVPIGKRTISHRNTRRGVITNHYSDQPKILLAVAQLPVSDKVVHHAGGRSAIVRTRVVMDNYSPSEMGRSHNAR